MVLCTAYMYIMLGIQAEPTADCKCTKSISKQHPLDSERSYQPTTPCAPECTILQQGQFTSRCCNYAANPAYTILLKITLLRLATANMMQATSAIQSWQSSCLIAYTGIAILSRHCIGYISWIVVTPMVLKFSTT